jgi:ubiquitin carboxyl-terminal hydrolase 25/28
MPALFKNASSLLTELSAINPTEEGAGDTMGFNTELAAEMEKLSHMTQAELAREYPESTVFA